ncbi:MAG: ATP-binding cassette domain-containing protein, partial [Clostridia bacterium]|nr:ATP-binding cassette domain-containing protein [Clostridia bacterium]
FKGKRIKTSKEKRLFWLNEAGFLFQNFALIENKTVKENLEIIKPSVMSDVSIDEALNKVGLLNKKDKKVFTLSGGEQQRIAIARLFLKKCNLILADEPTGSLDRKNADIVMELIRDLNKQGKTVVLVTHDERIINSAERVIRL